MSAQHHLDAVRQVSIDAMRDARLSTRQDLVVVEEPLEIRVAQAGDEGPGIATSITMRTPGQDIELAAGFLHGEGIVRSREDIAGSRLCGLDGNVVRIQLAEGAAFDASRLQRNFYTTSSCGVCGHASLAAVERMLRSPQVDGALKVPAALIESLPERARAGQDVFRETGGLHAACLFDAQGRLLDVRLLKVGDTIGERTVIGIDRQGVTLRGPGGTARVRLLGENGKQPPGSIVIGMSARFAPADAPGTAVANAARSGTEPANDAPSPNTSEPAAAAPPPGSSRP